MAAQPILLIPGTVTATGALVVSGDPGSATGGGTAPIANLLGVTAAAVTATAPPLLVRFV